MPNSKQRLLTSWQQTTIRANSYMGQDNWTAAMELYKQSLLMARQLLDQNCLNAIHAYTISCHNLADLYIKLNLFGHAKEQLEKAHNQVISIIEKKDLNKNQRNAAIKASSKSYMELLRFYKNYPQLFDLPPTPTAVISIQKHTVLH